MNLQSLRLTGSLSDKVAKVVWYLVIVLSVSIIATWIYELATKLGTQYPFSYGEAWNTWVGDMIGNGGLKHLYYPLNGEPYYQTPYTPMFYITYAVLAWIFGPSILLGRSISLFSFLVSSLLIFLIVRKITKNKLLAVVGSLLFLALPAYEQWAMFNFLDDYGIMFSLLGVYLALRFVGSNKILWAVIPLLLGIFSKQVYIAAPLAVCLYLLITNRWMLLKFGSLMLVGGFGLIGLFQLLSGGRFIDAIFGYPSTFQVYWELTLHMVSIAVDDLWVYIVIAAGLLLLFFRRREFKEPYAIAVFYSIFAVAIGVLTCGRIGSWINYMMDAMASTMMLIPILVWKVGELKDSKTIDVGYETEKSKIATVLSLKKGILIAIPLLVLYQLTILPNYSAWSVLPDSIGKDYSEVVAYASQVLDDVPILSEDCYILNEVGREPFWEPSYFSQFVKTGNLDQTEMLDRIGSKEFGLIILEWDLDTYYNWKPQMVNSVEWMSDSVRRFYTYGYMRMTDEMADAILANYQLKAKYTRLWVYEPKGEVSCKR